MMRLLARLYDLDRRWLFLATVLVLLLALIVPVPFGIGQPSPPTASLVRVLDRCPPDKVVLIDSSWDAGSAAENRAQFAALVRYLCARRIRFIVTSVGVTAFGPDFARQVAEPIVEAAGYVYGTDWAQFGYLAGPPGMTGGLGALIDGLCRDFHGRFPKDVRGNDIAALPLMAGVRTIDDLHLVAVITYAPAPEWMSFVNGQFGKPVAFGCMAIMGPTYYTYLDSRQLAGALIGNRGAADLESALGQPGRGTQLALAGSLGNCAVIAAALAGNLGWWAARRARRAAR